MNIPIFLSSDNNYAPFAAAAIASIADNTKSNVVFYILESAMTPDIQKRICALKDVFNNVLIEFIKIKENTLKNLANSSGYISQSTYNRFFIGDLKPEISKCLYLDVDLIVLEDIGELYSTDLKKYTIGAVEDLNSKYRNRSLFDPEHTYFNAGVLLIDLKKWNSENIKNKLFEAEKELKEKLQFADQDLLNKVFENNYLQLDKKYNVIEKSQSSEVAIRHYAGYLKPWQTDENLKTDLLYMSEAFWKYAKLTDFYNDIKKNVIYNNLQDLKFVRLRMIGDNYAISCLKAAEQKNKSKINAKEEK